LHIVSPLDVPAGNRVKWGTLIQSKSTLRLERYFRGRGTAQLRTRKRERITQAASLRRTATRGPGEFTAARRDCAAWHVSSLSASLACGDPAAQG
jgi:hypothetical protein